MAILLIVVLAVVPCAWVYLATRLWALDPGLIVPVAWIWQLGAFFVAIVKPKRRRRGRGDDESR